MAELVKPACPGTLKRDGMTFFCMSDEPHEGEHAFAEVPWSTRISAAIERGKRLVPETDTTRTLAFIPRREGRAQIDLRITAGEVALAEALWAWHCEYRYDEQAFAVSRDSKHYKEGRPSVAPALRTFTEKIEAVSSPVHRRS